MRQTKSPGSLQGFVVRHPSRKPANAVAILVGLERALLLYADISGLLGAEFEKLDAYLCDVQHRKLLVDRFPPECAEQGKLRDRIERPRAGSHFVDRATLLGGQDVD